MNFLRRRLFVAFGFLLVFLGGFPGAMIGERLFPSAHHTADPNAFDFRSQMSGPVLIAHLLLAGFLIFLHTRRADARILDQHPRSWLGFSYGTYAIGVALGVVVSAVMR